MEEELLTKYPNVSASYYVCSDTMGSIFTASPLGGMVLIAGTGSNALLRNPDGKTFTCGGWGNFLADEGAGMIQMIASFVEIGYSKMLLFPFQLGGLLTER